MDDSAVRADERLQFAALLEIGSTLTMVRADGPMVEVLVTAVDGVDLDVRPIAGALPTGALASTRLHGAGGAWFATAMVLDGESAVVRIRIGDALRVTSERWPERVALGGGVVLRPEAGLDAVVRGECLNASLTGVAVRVPGAPPAAGSTVGVLLAGDGTGSIAFRGRVVRIGRASHGSLVAVALVSIARDDHLRLARAIARAAQN
jgi:hypothetical protein